MTVAGSTQYRTFIDNLARSESGRLLHQELGRRWPETNDQLAVISRYALLPAGKLLRPIMTLHAAEAVGGSPADVLAAALGMEYLHGAAELHDDIIDDVAVRRGRPAAHITYGIPSAILTGDHLICRAFAAIVDEPGAASPGHVVAAVAALAAAGSDLCRGQILEAQMVGDLEAGVQWYPEMIRLKTGALFRVVCLIGALLGGAEEDAASALARYGENIGLAFQVRDDLLDYVATPEQTGKPAANDLGNGRPTLPFLLAYEAAADSERSRLLAVLRRRGSGDGDAGWVNDLLKKTGAVASARRQMAVHAEQARAELAVLVPSPSVDVLAGIAHWTASEAT
jgi:geranylgeranyl diphosphate synthase, type I